MKIRSITYFAEPGYPFDESRLASGGTFVVEARRAFEDAGFEVQSTRLALPPLGKTFGRASSAAAVKYAQDLEAACFVQGFDYAAIGVARPTDPPSFYEVIPDVISATQNIFASAIIASPLDGLSLPAVQLAAQIIHRCAALPGIVPPGFGNLRFAALANVESGVPFLPAAYHDGGAPLFAVATEAADLAVTAFAGAATLAEARARLVEAVESAATRITAAAKKITGSRAVRFGGIDFSLAPFPTADKSIGAALESLGVPTVGASGTLAAAAFVTDALNRAQYQHTGFSGLFMPVLEDSVLAARSAEGLLTVTDLLLYSTVCGTGLDTVPLAGDTTPAELAALLLDVGALALRLNKPLTARLMPMPGKQGGDEITFEFPFFANGRVMAIERKTRPLGGLLNGSESFDLARRPRS